MDQRAVDQTLRSTQHWSIFRPLIERGVSPSEIKTLIISILEPYFINKNILAKYAIPLLGSEAFRIARLKQDPWAAAALDQVSNIYSNARTVNATACYRACADSEPDVLAAVSEFWSIFHLQIDQTGLSLHEFKHEIFRNIGALLEGYLFPHLRDLLTQVRLTRGKVVTYAQSKDLSLGSVVDELHSNLSMPELVAPPRWGIRLNQWRNVAQHHRSYIHGDMIAIHFGRHPNIQQMILTRNELLDAFKRIHSICDLMNAARTLFCVDHIHMLSKHLSDKLEVRCDATIFALRMALSTQGFDLVDLQIEGDCAAANVRDMTEEPYEKRMIHASQFVYPVWLHLKKKTIVVRYIDKEGKLRLTTTGDADDFERISDGRLPFSELANCVAFRLEGA